MDNKDKYRFSDFTLSNYRKLIQITKGNIFRFISYDSDFANYKKCVLWRHDVEFSPDIALKMSEIENKENVKTTYFFQLHSEFYNVLEKHYSDIVHKIRSYGHDIGLHFDTHYFGIHSEKDIDKYLKIDKKYFESIFNLKLKAFSFHNTNKFILSCKRKTYAGLLNVYSDYFMHDFAYCADSTGFWRYEILEDVLKDARTRKIQVLTHDAMWQNKILPPRQRVFKAIDTRAEYLKKFYDNILKTYGAKNIDWTND